MEEKGDRLELPRDVHHWAYFKNQADRQTFGDLIRALGYRIESEKEHPNNDLSYGICIVKRQEMTRKGMDDAVLELFRASASADGEYDGWESEVIVNSKPGDKKSWWKWW